MHLSCHSMMHLVEMFLNNFNGPMFYFLIQLYNIYNTIEIMSGLGGPPPGSSVLQYYLNKAQPTYESANAGLASGRCACVVDPVPGGCSYASSVRNKKAIEQFTRTAEAEENLQIFVYLAGHSGMINTHQMQGEPKITVGCNTFFFNNAGESTFTPAGVGSNQTSAHFMRTLGELSDRHETINKGRFYSFLERFRDDALLAGSPISLYTLGTQIDDLNVLGAGTLYDTDYLRNPDGSYVINPDGSRIFNQNPASVRIFVKNGRNKVLGNLTSPNLIDMFQYTKGNLQMRPSRYYPGYFDITIDPYMYLDQLSGFRPVRLSDIYNFIRNAIAQAGLVTTLAEMNVFMSRHVVLVSLGCRCLGTGDVCRVESVERPYDPTLQLPADDNVRSIGGKKKHRQPRTRNHKHKHKPSKRKVTKRVKRKL